MQSAIYFTKHKQSLVCVNTTHFKPLTSISKFISFRQKTYMIRTLLLQHQNHF